jgi:hypothetical protein
LAASVVVVDILEVDSQVVEADIEYRVLVVLVEDNTALAGDTAH